jgi:hypothetical protein
MYWHEMEQMPCEWGWAKIEHEPSRSSAAHCATQCHCTLRNTLLLHIAHHCATAHCATRCYCTLRNTLQLWAVHVPRKGSPAGSGLRNSTQSPRRKTLPSTYRANDLRVVANSCSGRCSGGMAGERRISCTYTMPQGSFSVAAG